jgi:hypothetical protein
MHLISLAGSERQKSKLRNGHKVRVKHGKGFNVIVNPSTYHLVTRAFNKNKGVQMQLSPEEIAMNKAPSPELQAQIMGHNNHMILPDTHGALVKGSGIGDWFKNVGNQIKSGFEDKIINPIKENIVQPVQNLYEQNVPADVRRDINTGLRFTSAPGLIADLSKRLQRGEKIQDIGSSYLDDLRHLNDTKNKIIKSSPELTEAYKKGVPALAGVATGALGSAFGLSPVTGALVGAAGAKGAQELLKAEGYGLHHLIHHALHLHPELRHHSKPIGGALGWHHVRDFFHHAGNTLKNIYHTAKPIVEATAPIAHKFITDNPALAKFVKEHGTQLAGYLARKGASYLTGNEKASEFAGNMAEKEANKQLTKAGYGLWAGGGGLYAGQNPHGGAIHNNVYVDPKAHTYSPLDNMVNKHVTLNNTVGPMAGSPFMNHHMQGHGFNSYNSIRAMNVGTALSNAHLGKFNHRTVEGQIHQEPIKKYWDTEGEPPSRGTGIHPHHHHHHHGSEHLHNRGRGFGRHDHHNLIGGRGRLVEHSAHLPPALVSQPYGSNFHLQFQLPPQYHKYNDGTYTF